MNIPPVIVQAPIATIHFGSDICSYNLTKEGTIFIDIVPTVKINFFDLISKKKERINRKEGQTDDRKRTFFDVLLYLKKNYLYTRTMY